MMLFVADSSESQPPRTIEDWLMLADAENEQAKRQDLEEWVSQMHPDTQHMYRRMRQLPPHRSGGPLTKRDVEAVGVALANAVEDWAASLLLTDSRYAKAIIEHKAYDALSWLASRSRLDWSEVVWFDKYRLDFKHGRAVSITFTSPQGHTFVRPVDKYMGNATGLLHAVGRHTVRNLFGEIRFRVSFIQRECQTVQFKLEI